MSRPARVKKPAPPALVVHKPVLLAVQKLNPAAYNPRKISDADFAALKASMMTYGFIDPIAVQKQGLCIIGGHQRVKAVRAICSELGIALPKIPAIVLDISTREAMKLNVALNNVGGEFDARMLGQLLADMSEAKPLTIEEASFMGFEPAEADKYLRLVDAPTILPPSQPDDTIGGFGSSVTLSLKFTSVTMRDAVKKALTDKAATAEQTSGEFIAGLLGVA